MKKLPYILLSILSALYLVLNWIIPFIIDDLVYSRSFVGVRSMREDTDPDRMVNSFSEFCASIATHYVSIQDRYVVVILSQLFCIINKHVYDIFILFVLLLLLWLLGSEKGRGMSVNKMGVSFFLMLLGFSYPCVFHEGVAMGINYLYSTMMVTLLFFCLDKYEQGKNNIITAALLCILSVITAWGHECLSVPLSGGMFLMLLFSHNKLSTAAKAVYSFFIVATVIMILGPANIQRFMENTEDVNSQVYNMSPLKYHLIVFRYMRITYLWLILMALLFFKKKFDARIFVKENMLLILSIAVSIPFAVFIGGVNERVVFGTEIFSLILILRILWRMEWFVRHSNAIASVCLTTCIIILILLIKVERPYISALHEAERQAAQSRDSICTLIIEPQDSFPPLIQKYIAGSLNDFQLEQIRWKNHKKEVRLK